MNVIRRMAAPTMGSGDRLFCPASCTLDIEEKYRFTLERRWAVGPAGLHPSLRAADLALFVMLNPSTADALKDDATIRRCTGFVKSWGLVGFDVVNLFALRATDPKKLVDIYGAGSEMAYDTMLNNGFLLDAGRQKYAVTIFAWGANGALNYRDRVVAGFFNNVMPQVFGTTKVGQPLHPLRLAKTTKLIPYRKAL